MAAPSGTVWGSTVGSYGRIGIYVTTSNTNAETTVTVQVWFWSKYSVSDNKGNSLYLDCLAASGSATTNYGGTNIQTTVATGSGWSTSNQVLLTGTSYTYKYARGKSEATRYIYAKLTNVDRVGGTMYANTTVSIPALPFYTVTYNANGGSNAPSNQTKWYGESLTLSGTKPTRTGYSFQGWATSASATTAAYAAGASYTANAATTLYAVWKANTYTVSYNANGGTGAPGNQTKTYGVDLTLSSAKPTRTNYSFKGWATSASATTAAYAAGSKYTTNTAVTLYAVWELSYVKPRISDFSVDRCLQDGTASDDGTYARVRFKWACDQTISSITVHWEDSAGTEGSKTVSASSTSGSVNEVVGGSLDTEKAYAFDITVRDAVDASYARTTLTSRNFTIDCLAGGNGIAFGKAAERPGFAEFGFNAVFNGSVEGNVFGLGVLPQIGENEDFNTYLTPGVYGIGAHATAGTIANNPAGAQAGRLIVCAATGGNVGIQYWSYIQQWYIPMSFEASKQNAIYVRTITRSPNAAPNYYAWLKFTAVAV